MQEHSTDHRPAHSREQLRWYFRLPALIASLILLYPLGLILLLKSPALRRRQKAFGVLLSSPLLLVTLLLALIPYWDFGGGMKASGFKIDLTRGWWQDRRVEKHRETQSALHAESFSPSPETIGLRWPAFRGPRRDGVADATISLDWNKTPPKEIWRQPIGEGYASFVVGHGRIYTIEQRRGHEAVTSYDLKTGRELWIYRYEASFEETLGGDGPRATPTLHGNKLYALGAEGALNCLGALTGERYWGTNILADFGAENLTWGLSGSPLIVDNKVIVTNSGKGGDSILAYDAERGTLLWKTDAGQQGYSSPMLATLNGRRQILNFAAYSLHGIDPETGDVIWSLPWKTQYGINCSQPLLPGGDRLFISSGYGYGCALIKIESVKGAIQPRKLWSNSKMKNKFTSSVLHNGFIYGLNERVLGCLDLETGERKWKGGRYDYGSILLVGNHILVLSEDGRLALVKADPKQFQEIARIQILEGRTWNNMALAGGLLFARNHKEMVCYDLRPR
ncbi:MAG: PQQ-like beta-propeller repeat protein [Phycisphaerales bacterium]|nr:PQQ-like beta-propeller repeat protein [Phycisphaerales bacterium]